MVMSRGLVGASHRIVIRYPISGGGYAPHGRTATGACRMAAARSSGGPARLSSMLSTLRTARGPDARRHQSSHGSDALRTALSTETGDASRLFNDDAFRFRELIVLRCDEFTRFASRARAVTTEQIHTVGVRIERTL